ncbi:LANO_0A07382g1_1 [Lachancea nothofagi CBS 11611]|uniref:LANO_0A07382g1_1 n=1 Tax=Lachancea nothofagi CBS 11611 TaxID=1266666 RepID=A0A1G4IS86_9SACH|nr:LANO_0A07382g1_1 [Lachancea nothofagi CBS 11611]
MDEKRRKRGAGPFSCPFTDCDKAFSRSDHLTRHKANHSSNKVKCQWPGCGRMFSRLDVKKKHEGRHIKNNYEIDHVEQTSNIEEATYQESASSSVPENVVADEPEDIQTSRSSERMKTALDMIKIASLELPDPIHRITGANDTMKTTTNLIGMTRPQTFHEDNQPKSHWKTADNTLKSKVPNSEFILPSRSIQWLLSDPTNLSPPSGRFSNQPENGAFHVSYNDPLGPSTSAMLQEIFALSPEFPNADGQTKLDEDLLSKMAQHIPSLRNHPDFAVKKLELFLEIYWLLYHCQYPILHRPSFCTHDVQPVLLLSMIMIGASFSKKTLAIENLKLVDPDGLAEIIADPLRWLIFASEQAKPPCKSWVIQSLIILETYEITSTSRSMHERACIHNGAKVQLLRRSPILGGDPLKEVGTDVSRSKNLWSTWIESESMKRVALMSFYIDSVHAIVYGHPLNLFANQIKLSLPCPDELWEYSDVNRHEAPLTVVKMPLFGEALQKLLRKEEIDVGPFSRQILLAGLINLMLQIEQNISQWSNFGWNYIQENWRETISSALEVWRTQLPMRDCCLTSSSVYPSGNDFSFDHLSVPPIMRPEDTRCSCPVYHAAQIYMKIAHYDYIVYAGAPRRMNVPILEEDYEIVVKRIGKWAKSQAGPLCVINSIILLCEVLLSPESSMEVVSYSYEPDKDPFIYRPNIVISAILSLWAYAHYSFGPESLLKSASSNFQIIEGCAPAMEDGPTYLSRIRNEFKSLTGKSFAQLKHMNTDDYSNTIREYYDAFPKVSKLNFLVGLLISFRNGYAKCKWDVGREYANLLDNCIQRSLGSEIIFCRDMYDVNDQ